jgi:hypothetical protein
MLNKKVIIIGLFFLLITFAGLYRPSQIVSVPPTNVKDTLSSSQLSFFGRLGVGNTANNTTLNLVVGSSTPSQSTHNLFVGDTISIGVSGSTGLSTYIISDIASTGSFQITSGLGSSNAFAGLAVVATRSAIHTLSFTPKTNIDGGAWQFLLKASTRVGETWNDGIPDQQGFDFGMDVGSTTTGPGTRLKVADVTCPWGATASVGTTTVIGVGSTGSFIVIQCTLGAGITNPINVGTTITIGRPLTTGSQLINPAPASNHTPGKADSTADVYTFYVRHLDASSIVIDPDTASGRIAVVESVRVTATIDPTLTFYIDNTNVGTGSTVCGNVGGSAFGANAANTTATSVAFGSINLGSFNNLAQRLSCVTNSDSGYAVTVYENSAMKNVNTGTTIPNTNCDAGTCTYSVGNTWVTDTTQSSWGYTLQNINANTIGVGSTSIYKAFGIGNGQVQSIMSNSTTPTATEQAYICYRLVASTTQEAGNYENQLIYTATATF